MLFSKGRIPDFIFEDKNEEAMEKTAQRHPGITLSNFEPFNPPDVSVGDTWAIWYGHGGPESEFATEVESDGRDYRVRDYTYISEGTGAGEYLVQEAYVEEDDIVDLHNVSPEELEGMLGLRWAAAVGKDFIANGINVEESTADELPQ
jgi:hypothetical protein